MHYIYNYKFFQKSSTKIKNKHQKSKIKYTLLNFTKINQNKNKPKKGLNLKFCHMGVCNLSQKQIKSKNKRFLRLKFENESIRKNENAKKNQK